jgi:hypothetical protein
LNEGPADDGGAFLHLDWQRCKSFVCTAAVHLRDLTTTYGAGAEAGAEALQELDVRQEDLLAGGDPFSGKRQRQDPSGRMEESDEED